MTAVNLWVGNVDHDSASVIGKASPGAASVELLVSTDPDMSSPITFGPVAPDAQDIVSFSATGLTANVRHYYALDEDGTFDALVDPIGTFRTHVDAAGAPFSFTFAAGGCAGAGPPAFPGDGSELDPDHVSNHPVFAEIADRAIDSDWLFFMHTGDMYYYNLGQDLPATLANYRTAIDDVLHQSNQQTLYKDVPLVYMWDDHDFDGNNSDGTFADKLLPQQVYRERVPSYPLAVAGGGPANNPIYHSFEVGRVLFIVSDIRSSRSPTSDPDGPSKTMLGTDQKTWMDGVLSTSSAEFLVWLNPQAWLVNAGAWPAYGTEVAELVDMFDTHGWLDRMMVVSGDSHYLAMDNGFNTPGGVPLFVSNHLDSSGGGSSVPYTQGPVISNKGQYGTVTITDDGVDFTVTMRGWAHGEVLLREFSFSNPQPPPPPPPPPLPPQVFPDVSDLLIGSHGVVFDVRVLETFQTGDDPQGTQIAFAGELTELGLNVGEVELDATRTIRGTAFIRVPGTFGTDGESSFPRGRNQLLAPFGNEVFIRYGFDLGASILWIPLGYYRITDTHQDDAPNSPVELFCHDRTATIEDSELIDPRSYSPPQTVGDVFADLVGEIYPDAVIVFDDETGTVPLASQIVAEKNRWKPLVEMADSFGKILYWDGTGQLRVETPPDPDTIVWELRSNRDGVLVEAQRELSREGIFNAVVVEGEKTGDADPVRAVAIHDDPGSPTRFGGPIGRVPTFLNTPLVSTELQAQNAARFLLQRALGAPYTVSTESIVNPTIRPYEAIRITYTSHDRDIHLVDRVRIPLDEDAGMAIDTREKALIVIGFQ